MEGVAPHGRGAASILYWMEIVMEMGMRANEWARAGDKPEVIFFSFLCGGGGRW
jgi:hypothetical protein